jgi:hypothetical protein
VYTLITNISTLSSDNRSTADTAKGKYSSHTRTPATPYIVYALRDEDIDTDLKVLRRATIEAQMIGVEEIHYITDVLDDDSCLRMDTDNGCDTLVERPSVYSV